MLYWCKYKIKSNNMQEYDEIKVHPYYNTKAKLPNKCLYPLYDHIKVPFCNVENMKKCINNTLSEIEGIHGEYDEEKYMWNLEYGTKPIEYTIEPGDWKLNEIILQKKFWALLTSRKAFEQFHQNDYDYGFDKGYAPLPFRTLAASRFSVKSFTNRKWCKINISLSYDEENNEIIVEFNREKGERETFYFVSNIIKCSLKI
jgi:hypothetical protein